MRFIPHILVLVAVSMSAGCATFDVPWFDRVPEASAKNPVVKVMCMWEPAEGRDPNGLPCRGFAGQILFLGNKGGVPVKVHGDVKIYVFDDFGTVEEQATPLHVYNFEGSWDRHLKVGTFGPAYHVFVPYTRRGQFEANCALRLQLQPPDGPAIYSDMCDINLKGKARDQLPEAATADAQLPAQPPAPQTRTTTIPLDRRYEEPRITPLDTERANRLLEEFLRKQTQEHPAPDAAIEQSAAPERIRFDGQRVEVINRTPATHTAHADNLDGQTSYVTP
jgi:hypothetical protein